MPLNIQDIFPNYNVGLNKIGFFFGAGTSKEAGFPLTIDLTRNVINKLGDDEKKLLEDIFQLERMDFSSADGSPDIEVISNLVYKHLLSQSFEGIEVLEESIRKNIFSELTSIKKPNLENHILFLKALKKLLFNRAESIWIFTTNYDLLFEMAAMEAEIPVYNGFEGILNRYFDINRLHLKYGKTETGRFQENKEPNIKLIKLHGSISWFKRNEKIYEKDDSNQTVNESRIMILPRIQKVIDTLEYPYDHLFRYSNQIIGTQCLYIVSCGYSFRDQHINDQLIIPYLQANKIHLTAFFDREPENINQFKQFSAFNYLTANKKYFSGKEIEETSDTWKFSEFVKLFTDASGM